MKILCSACKLEFDLPGDDWKDAVVCPKCRAEIRLQSAETVRYSPTDVPRLSPPGGAPRPTALGEDEVLPAGALVGQYEIAGFVGRGGMGAVYRARHAMLQRTVALKVLPPKFARDAEFVQRFRREAQALANLAHPNIVAVHDMGVQGEIYFFAMEFVDGVSLRDVLAQKKLSPEDALKIVPQLCEALEYAHSQGIIHRDIKPENILVDRAGRPKIADFGLAKIVKGETASAPLTRTNMVMGTAEYMAPEQRDNLKQVDHRADIYSLGVVLYEMLTGQLPVGRFDPPSKRVRIDVRIDDVVLKALDQDPGRRYQRASHMGTDVSMVGAAAPARAAGECRAEVRIELPGAKRIWSSLTPKQREKIGVYVIVNAALFLFFGLVAGNLTAPLIIAIFWGMGLALQFWKVRVRGPQPEAGPAPAAPPPPPRRTSAAAVLGFLASLPAFGLFVATAILTILERGGSALEIRANEITDLRIALATLAFLCVGVGAVAFFLCAAASSHVARSEGAMKGRAWASAGMLLSIAPVVLATGFVLPRLARLHGETRAVRAVAEEFATKAREGDWKAAHALLDDEGGKSVSPERLREAFEKAGPISDLRYLRVSRAVVSPRYDRAEIRFDQGEAHRLTAVRSRDGWRIAWTPDAGRPE